MTSDSRYRTLVIEQGKTLKQVSRMRSPAGVMFDPVDEGYTSAILQVRDAHLSEGGELMLELTTDNGGVVLGEYDDGTGTLWSLYIYATATTTGDLSPWGEGQHELVLIHSGGAVETYSYGPAALVPATVEG